MKILHISFRVKGNITILCDDKDEKVISEYIKNKKVKIFNDRVYVKEGKFELLPRVLFNIDKNTRIYYNDGNTYNVTKQNINVQNTKYVNHMRGITKTKRGFQVMIKYLGQIKQRKTFDNIIDAKKFYNENIIKYYENPTLHRL